MRLIDADAIPWCNYDLNDYHSFVGVDKEYVDEMPTIEAEPVRHGRWIVRNKGTNNWVDCSECGTVGSPHWKRCPVCEAKMDVTDINVGNKDGGAE